MAGSSLTLANHESPAPSVGRLVINGVADDTDGSFPALVLPEFDGRILDIITNPGTPAPTAAYDVEVQDADAFDLIGGAGANRSATVTERAAVTDGYVARHEPKSLVITNNVVNDAQTVVTIHYTTNV